MQDAVIQKSYRYTQMLPFWGQYIAHDISNVPITTSTYAVHHRYLAIQRPYFFIQHDRCDLMFKASSANCI